MRRIVLAGLLVGAVLSCLPGGCSDALDAKNRGLFITPIREYITVTPGKSSTGTVTVANLTKEPMDVTLSTEQFSVADYTYDYLFQLPHEDWIKITTPTVRLAAGESRQVSYQTVIPKNAEPGGHYFTVLASTSPHPNEAVRAAAMLYVTVSGKLIKTSTLLSDTVPFISLGGDIPFRFDVRNTGNAHFFAYVSGKLEGLSAQRERNDAAHIVIPQTTRVLEGVFTAPLIPGVYKAKYGYKTDEGVSIIREKYIVYAPLWGWAIVAGMLGLLITWANRRHRSRKTGRAVY